ncbi:MAG TPA: hypothetical protein PKD12_00205 [Nitrospira sp.]|nr:hypothetical protein [Nitrospira sp.]
MHQSNDTPLALNVRLTLAGGRSMRRLSQIGTVAGALVLVLITSSSAGLFKEDTVAERFEKAIKEIAKQCASRKLAPNEVCGEVAKLKPADPLATEEGRFAHNIKIPNPVPEDSGYKPGMTPEQYFEHLCKTEAGEFIYKTVENVEGIYQMRPRYQAPAVANHLYAIEDPYGSLMEGLEAENLYVRPTRYKFFESPDLSRRESEGVRKYLHPSYFDLPTSETTIARYFGYDGHRQSTKRKEYDSVKKSHYGYTWRGISRPSDRELGIAGGELIVLDLLTNEVLGVHRGYAKFEIEERMGVSGLQWRKRCSTQLNQSDGVLVPFILKVLKPKLKQ